MRRDLCEEEEEKKMTEREKVKEARKVIACGDGTSTDGVVELQNNRVA